MSVKEVNFSLEYSLIILVSKYEIFDGSSFKWYSSSTTVFVAMMDSSILKGWSLKGCEIWHNFQASLFGIFAHRAASWLNFLFGKAPSKLFCAWLCIMHSFYQKMPKYGKECICFVLNTKLQNLRQILRICPRLFLD